MIGRANQNYPELLPLLPDIVCAFASQIALAAGFRIAPYVPAKDPENGIIADTKVELSFLTEF